MSKFDDFRAGDKVMHESRGRGIVRAVDDCVRIEFEDSPGRVSAAFDREWFRMRPNTLKPARDRKPNPTEAR